MENKPLNKTIYILCKPWVAEMKAEQRYNAGIVATYGSPTANAASPVALNVVGGYDYDQTEE